jgi:nitrite reductase/ring-hydroxylating ferredoxin subunit
MMHEMRPTLPPFPTGWYAVSLSRDLRPGEVRPMTFMGEEIILYRTESGKANVLGAYCPHLGAHLGYGGTLRGECISCPFHKFEFDTSGQCTYVPYGTRIPPKARATVFPTLEINKLILAYYDPTGALPEWEPTSLEMTGWSDLIGTQWTLRGHPQETTENSVDIGHFTEIHGYHAVEILKELVTQGPYLTTQYTMTRQTLGQPLKTIFEIHVHGLGYSQVDVVVPKFGVRGRLFVLATPIDGEQITLRIALSLDQNTQPGNFLPLLDLIPRQIINPVIAWSTLAGFKHDVEQDLPIWQHKRYIQPPILAEGDGPIGRYRQWVKQFYTELEKARI